MLCHVCRLEEGMHRCPQCGRVVCPSCWRGSLCAVCNEERLREEERKRQAQEAKLREERSRLERIFSTNTGLGQCPQCGSRNISEIREDLGGGNPGAPAAACCIGFFLFWPLILLAPFLGSRPIVGVFRRCNYCGYKWRL